VVNQKLFKNFKSYNYLVFITPVTFNQVNMVMQFVLNVYTSVFVVSI